MKNALSEIEQAATVGELTKLLKRFRSLKYEKPFITALLAKKSAIEKAGTASQQMPLDFDPPDVLGVDEHGPYMVKMVNEGFYPEGLEPQPIVMTDKVFADKLAVIKRARREYNLSMFGPNWKGQYDNSTEG